MRPPRRAWACVLALAGCESGGSGPDAGASLRPPSLDAGPLEVDSVPVVARPLETTVHLQGELGPFESVAVFPRVSAFVSALTVDRGATVRRGQLLVHLVAPELAAQRSEAQARLHGDESTLGRLRAAAQTPGVVAAHDLELADAAVQADRARVRSLRELEQYLTVTAPFDGVVTERNVHPGALVGPTSAAPMLRLEQSARLRLTVAVPEALAAEIAQGSSTSFTVRAWPMRPFTGRITRPSRTIDVRTRTMAVELDVDNADGRLAPGMYADVAWPVRRAAPSLFVPVTAVLQSTDRVVVLRLRDGSVEPVPVQRGVTVGDMAEVFGALAAGDMVARRGTEELRAGTRVLARVRLPDAGAGR